MRISVLFLMLIACCSYGQADTIYLSNPSFEDRPRQGGSTQFNLPIEGWFDCGLIRFKGESPPDIHPTPGSAWKVQKYAIDGDTYLGMVVRDNDSWESLSQRLSHPLEKGSCYSFSIFLSRSGMYESRSHVTQSAANYVTPTVLRIYAGNGFCGQQELLAESEPITNDEWRQFNFKFEPSSKHSFIVIEAFYKTPVLVPYNGHLLIDGASQIVKINCNEELIHEPLLVQQSLKQDESKSIAKIKKPKSPTKAAYKSGKNAQVGVETDTSSEGDREIVQDQIKSVAPVQEKKKIAGLDRKDISKGQTVLIDQLYFKADAIEVSDESYPILEEVYDFLEENDDIVVEIQGHTNGRRGITNAFCDELSTQRAKEVATYLAERGIASDRLKYKGYGKRKPIATNLTKEGRLKNQRVEIKILSIES